MSKLPASTGWLWIKEGLALFMKQPGGLTSLALLYAMLNMVISIIPIVGQLGAIVLIPVFSLAFMQACADIDQGKRIVPALLATGFRKPQFPSLFAVGLLYLVVAGLAIGVSTLADGGMLMKMLTGQIDPASKEVRQANLSGAFLLTILVCLPAAMGFCFAAPLIYWQRMSVGKAIFFSFFSVLRSLKAFIVFALSQFGLTLMCTQVIMLILGRSQFALTMVMPIVMLLLSVLIHCAFYASYRHIFGSPVPKPAAAAE
ncbi:BPSS1780 family membrane protein [Pseudoduganella namucuonensis]|uniref:Transmembrane protein n=1 Tax=Pseudoduganella namucuonensis TaxID=1035707 RepID=A0A1I7EUS2_9BURK|nr:BPSS1780 family membrane protein [Pseudoduganella namucuonensis]SFU27652.1 hypothetical protein SAMN05216552_1001132 [Pseudoduganella namucuonensis]